MAGAWESFKNAAGQFGEALSPLVTGPNPDATLSGTLNAEAQKAAALAESQRVPAPASAEEPVMTEAVPAQAEPVVAPEETVTVTKPDGTQYSIAKNMLTPSQLQMVQSQRTPAAVQPMGSIQTAKQGLQTEAAATDLAGKEQAAAYATFEDQAAKAKQAHDVAVKELMADRNKLRTEIEAGSVDPNRFWNNKSTAGKIGAGLAILLGGFSSNPGRENPAMAALKGQIEADIKSQMENLGTKKSLLSENYKQLGDLNQAYTQTLSQMLTGIEVQVKKAAAAAQGPIAKGKAQQALAVLMAEQEKLQATLAAERAKKDIARESKFIPTLGIYANSEEGAKEVRNLAGTVRSAQSGIAHLLRIADMSGKALTPEVRGEADVIAARLEGLLRLPLVGPGAVNESERALIKSVISNPARVFSLDSVSRKKLNTLSARLEEDLLQAAKAQASTDQPVGSLPSNMIKVRLPNGDVGAIPSDKAEQARKLGAKFIK